MLDISKFIDKRLLSNLSKSGMHKVAAKLEKLSSGRDIGEVMDLPSAISLLGEKAFIKRAEHRFISNAVKSHATLRS